MSNIIPITDLRNTSEISELCHNSDEPIFVTKNGYGDLVIMSIENYKRDLALVNVYKKLLEAEMQVEAGELLDGDEVFEEFKNKYVK